MLSDEIYALALTILNNHYSSRRVIVESHFTHLWEMKKTVLNDGKSIRQLLNHITEATGALKNSNYAIDQHLFQQKWDGQLRAQWELLVDTAEEPSVAEFVTFLTKFCNVASVGSLSKAKGDETDLQISFEPRQLRCIQLNRTKNLQR